MSLIDTINEIVEYGLKQNISSKDEVLKLKKLLTQLHLFYLNSEVGFDDLWSKLKEPPRFDYGEIKKNVNSNFPNFGFYHSVLNPIELHEDPKLSLGDAEDDLTDIVLGMLQVKWLNENSNTKYFEWHFHLIWQGHLERHFVDLLKYISDLEELD